MKSPKEIWIAPTDPGHMLGNALYRNYIAYTERCGPHFIRYVSESFSDKLRKDLRNLREEHEKVKRSLIGNITGLDAKCRAQEEELKVLREKVAELEYDQRHLVSDNQGMVDCDLKMQAELVPLRALRSAARHFIDWAGPEHEYETEQLTRFRRALAAAEKVKR